MNKRGGINDLETKEKRGIGGKTTTCSSCYCRSTHQSLDPTQVGRIYFIPSAISIGQRDGGVVSCERLREADGLLPGEVELELHGPLEPGLKLDRPSLADSRTHACLVAP